jgi:hypothetical protein
MCPGNDNHVDWSAAATPEGERVVPSLTRDRKPVPEADRTRRNVMDTLLGKTDLAAMDIGGSDPYNATGRHFRR